MKRGEEKKWIGIVQYTQQSLTVSGVSDFQLIQINDVASHRNESTCLRKKKEKKEEKKCFSIAEIYYSFRTFVWFMKVVPISPRNEKKK